MSTLTKKRLLTAGSKEDIALVENDEDVDLQFVVQGDFFDGEEFNPVIMTDNQEAHINGSEDEGPEFVDLQLRDEDDAGDQYAVPVMLDDDQSMKGGRKTAVNTFNYAEASNPSFLKGVPSELPADREANLGSAVVSL